MKNNTKRTVLIITASIIIAILLIAVIGYAFISNYYSQKKVVERIFSLRADMKLEEYYNCFDIPEESKSYMNSLEAYLLMAEEKGWDKIDSFEVLQKRKNTYSISYGNTEETLELVKQSKKGPLGHDTYKIKIESVTEPILYIYTKIDSDITIDDTSVKSTKVSVNNVEKAYQLYLEMDMDGSLEFNQSTRNLPIKYFEYYDEIYDNYCFTSVFDREYKITITTEFTTPFETYVSPSEETYLLRDLILNEETENQIKEVGESFIQKYYYALQNGDDFDEISHLITSNEEKRNFFKKDYEELFEFFTRGKEQEGLVDICFLNCVSTVNYPGIYDTNQNEYAVMATLDYSYNSISYDEYLDEYEYHNDMFDSKLFVISCVNEDGKWVVCEVNDTFIKLVF